jgi:hypothetical protein
MSAIGTKRTIRPHPPLSAIGVTADIGVRASRIFDSKAWGLRGAELPGERPSYSRISKAPAGIIAGVW